MYKITYNYATRNIIRTPLRSFFTVFSIAMIFSMYILLTAVADSFTGGFNKLIKQENIDIIIQSKFSATPLSSSISKEDFKAIVSNDAISKYIGFVIGKKRFKDRNITYLLGMDNFEQVSKKLGITLKNGRLFNSGTNEILMAERLLQIRELKIGDEVTLSAKNHFKIVCTYHSWVSFFNSSIIGDLKQIRKLLKRENKTNMLFLILKDSEKSEEIIKEINHSFNDLYAIKSGDFSQALGAMKNIFYLSDIIAIITLIIASAILINTFLMAVYQRTKEIGILSAIGWTRRMIISMFITESVILSIIGGIVGFILSLGMLFYLKENYSNIGFLLPEGLSILQFFYTLLMSLLIGIISAIIPAIYATKIAITKAIYHE